MPVRLAYLMSDPDQSSPAESASSVRFWRWSGFLAVVIGLLFLECRDPFYFSQDDNYSGAIPGYVLMGQTLFHGRIPTIDPYQFLGAPLLTMGTAPIFYPPFLAAYAFARWALGDPNLIVDVFVAMHILAGYAAAWTLCRRLQIRASLSALVALSWCLSGWALIVGRSWCITAPLLVYLPVCCLLLLRLQARPPDWRWLATAGVTLALFLNSGFVQLWAYTMILAAFWCGVAVIVRTMRWQRMLWLVPALLIGFALSAPMLMAFRENSSNWQRTVEEGPRMVLSNLLNVLLPASLAPPIWRGPDALFWGSSHFEQLGEMYYAGTVLPVIGVLAGIATLVCAFVSPRRRRIVTDNVWALLAIVALAFAFGSQSFLWPILSFVPLFDKMEDPFKFFPFFLLFALLGGAAVVERALRSAKRPARAEAGLVVAVVVLLSWHLRLAEPSCYSFQDRPYPAMPADMAALLHTEPFPQRIVPIAPVRSIEPNFPVSMVNNWATQYRIPAVWGYDPATAVLPDTLYAASRFTQNYADAARAYGVGWLVMHRTAAHPTLGPNPMVKFLEVSPGFDGTTSIPLPGSDLFRSHVVHVFGECAVVREDGADPMAFPTANPGQPLPITMDASGEYVDVSSLPPGTPVTVNLLVRNGMAADVDGQPAPITRDGWHRVQVTLPAGRTAHTLAVGLPVPWTASALFFAVFAAMTAGTTLWLQRARIA
jgi:hypothetical protein